ncbi:hypothetical protein BX591_10483 [Paraburkholderia bryophila]|uniref:Uncharacterized protein n=1 Tax=Paraburkholderia bryophila TaxID=420952 RepID=A0A329CLP6_9BURK|nr:hypothetical protein BX591_10483 [Paraburkholderia bryophila]
MLDKPLPRRFRRLGADIFPELQNGQRGEAIVVLRFGPVEGIRGIDFHIERVEVELNGQINSMQ